MTATMAARTRRATLAFAAVASGVIYYGTDPAGAAPPECPGSYHACYSSGQTHLLTHERAVERMSSFQIQPDGVDNDNSRRECGYYNSDYSTLKVSTPPGVENNFSYRTVRSVKWSPDVTNCPG